MTFAHYFVLFIFCVQIFAPAVLAEEAGSGALVPFHEEPEETEESEDSEELSSSIPEASSDSSVSSASSESSSSVMPIAPSPLAVRISELQWVGSDLSTADEWLEITAFPVMTGSVLTNPLALNGWTIRAVKDDVETVITTFTQQTIQSGSYLVVSNYDAPQSRLKKSPVLITSALSLANTKLLLRLRDGSGVLVDEVDDGVGNPFAGGSITGGIKASMERADIRAGNTASNWKTATTVRGLDANSLVRGTPGYPNGTVEPPDLIAPETATNLQAYTWSGSLLISWSPSRSEDLASQVLRLKDDEAHEVQVLSLPVSATGVVLVDNPTINSVSVQSIDDSDNTSIENIIQVQPLNKPIISELMPDPFGSDSNEWIELHNEHTFDIPMNSWVLKSGSSKYVFTGSVMHAGDVLTLPSAIHHLGLPNAGGEVSLIFMGRVIDRLAYGQSVDGVSFGRMPEHAQVEPFCVPTPTVQNERRSPGIKIDSLVTSIDQSQSLNLNVSAKSGSLAGAQCHWDFGDGYQYEGCNPPLHKMKAIGDLFLSVEVHDYCGNTMKHSEKVRVFGKGKLVLDDAKNGHKCTPTSFSGVSITEFLAHPEKSDQEWIEIRNTSSGSLALCGWSIDDQQGGSKPYPLDGVYVESGAYFLLPRSETSIALNDDQDVARLIAPLPSGGTGVLMSVFFQDAPEEESFALRNDGEWLWTRYVTPQTENRFQEVDTSMGESPIVISAALPNPKGLDTDEEWFELQNLTVRPQWLNGWTLMAGDHAMDLQGMVLARKEVLRIKLKKQPFTLTNEAGTLRLVDPEGNVRSVLSWRKAKDGKQIQRYEPEERLFVEQARVTDLLTLNASVAVEDVEEKIPVDVKLVGIGLLPSDIGFESIINNSKNLLSSLIKDKKVELQNDSLTDAVYAVADGVDVSSMLIQLGFSVVTGEYDFARKWEFFAYEEEARKNKRGVWALEGAEELLDDWRSKQEMDAKVKKEGLVLTVNTPSGLVSSGAIITFKTNLPTGQAGAPAKVFLMTASGSVDVGTGIVITRDTLMNVFAEYGLQTGTGGIIRSTVLTREYVVKRASYPTCLRISEVYPSPAEGKEWIELYNKCDQEISLGFWSVDDELEKGSKRVKLSMKDRVPAYGYYVLSGSSIAFNNGGDGAAVLDPGGKVQDIIRFPTMSKGLVYALVGDTWCKTAKRTPGMANECVNPPAKKKTSSSKKMKAAKIGLRTVFSAMLLGSEGAASGTNIDQRFSQLEGVEDISANKENRESVLQLIALGSVVILICSILRWYWRKMQAR